MSEFLPNFRTATYVNGMIQKLRHSRSQVTRMFKGMKTAGAWSIALVFVLCAMLVGGISLFSRLGKQQSKNTGTLSASAQRQTNVAPAPPKSEQKQSAKVSANTSAKVDAKNHPSAVKTVPIKRDSKAEKVAEKQTKAQIRLRPEVRLSPSQLDAKTAETEQESGDEVRRRASWFFDQRAYPNKHIPPDAFQKAIQQRDSMRQQQRAAFQPSAGAQAIISFPGDAVWHLMGPQPINTPFGQNSGFPIASGRVTAVAVDPTNANIVYVGGAAGGVWKTTDGGTTWTPLTDSQPALAVGSIAIDPNSCSPGPCTTIYVGTGEDNFNGDAFYGAGILQSKNGGTSWSQLGASSFAGALTSGTGGAQIGGIAVQPGNANVILASVFFFDGNDANGGVWRSTDGGVTWVRPTTGGTGSAGTGVFFESTVVPPATVPVAWAALGDIFPGPGTSNGIWRSTDLGVTWTRQTGGLPASNVGRITLGYASSTAGATATVYAVIGDASTPASRDLLGIFKTVNGGTAWTSVTGPAATGGFCGHQCFYDMAIGVSPTNPNVVVLGGGAGPNNFTSLFESTNGGTSWTPATAAAGDFSNGSTSTHPHVDTHAIVFSANGATLYVGNDGGIWSTNTPTPPANTSPTWSDLNAQLAITQFYPGVTAATNDENYGFGGTQDNDTELFQNSLTWQNEFICGDGGFTAIDKTTPTTIWAGCNVTAGAKIKKAVMNGQYLTFANSQQFPGFDVAETAITGSGDAMQFIPPIAVDDGNPENVYFGTCRVWQTTNGASSLANSFVPLTPTWNPISNDLSNGAVVTTACPAPGGAGNITNLEVAHSNSSVIVAGTSNGKVWETISGGGLWTEIDASALPNRSITAVRTKRSDSTGNIVYVTLSGFGACGGCGATPGHVFKSTNAAGGAPTWTNISGNLPDIPVNDIVVDHSSNPLHDALYIATDVGVFACPDPEAATPCTNWTVIGDGLPNSPVLGLALRRHSRILRAGTHGRSMWEIQLSDVGLSPLAALSSVTPAAVLIPPSAGNTPVTVTGINFSANTQVTTPAGLMGITTTFVNTTQLNVTIPNSLLQTAGVFPVLLTDPAGVDSGSTISSQGIGGLQFTVMNPLLDPASMTPAGAQTYTAVPLHLTSAAATEFFVPGTVLAFYNTSVPPILQFTLPSASDPAPTITSNGTVYDLTTVLTDFITPGTYQVFPYNPTPGGGIDALSLAAAVLGAPVPFTFTVTANPGPVALVTPNPITLGPIAVSTSTSTTTFQIQNTGTANPLSISAATLTPVSPPAPQKNFKFVPPTLAPSCNFDTTGIASVAAGASCFFGIQYTAGTPPGNANSTATLNITDNAPGSPQSISVTGLVLTASSSVLLIPSPPAINVNFGAVAIGTTSATMNATLFNTSNAGISVTSAFNITGTNLADFQLVPFVANGDGRSACPTSVPFPLAAFANCDVTLTFTPSIAGTETATLGVNTSAGNPTVALTGVGIEVASISPSVVATGGPAFTLTVNGGGFATNAVVNVSSINGTNVLPRLTTFVSANQLLASIPASDITTAGTLAVTVTTGGVTSEPKTLVVAQAPVATNDNINFAINAGPSPFRNTQDTTQASAQLALTNTPLATPADPTPASPSCAPASATLAGRARSVWYQFKAPANGKVSADTRFSSYTTILSVWTINNPLPNTSETFTSVACASGNISGTTPESLVTFAATGGQTYYVMVTDATNAATAPGGTLTFSLDFASAAPTNDDNITAGPNGPTVINPASLPYSNTVNSIQATANTNGHPDPALPGVCATGAASSGQANSVWYSFTPTSSGTVVADTLTSPYETILNVTSGTPTGAQVACNQSAGAGIAQSQVSFSATSGVTYFFMVSSFLGDGGTTNFHLNFTASASNPVPTITSFSPTSATAGGAAFALTVNGTNFVSGATGTFNGAARTVTFVSATQVTMAVTAADIVAAGSFPVIVSNPAPGGGPSAPMNFPVNNPLPTTTSISPTSATAGGGGFTLTVNGTNFNASSVVNFNSAAKTTTFVSATQVTASILAADIATAATVNVTVTNPAPGGGTSNAQTFTINNPVPTITSLSPTGATAGGPAFTLTVNGTGFVATSSVKFNGAARTTTFVSATQVTAAILAADIATAGTPPVTVTNPAPGGGTSAPVNFNVSAASNPVPTLTSISPTTTAAGGAAFTLTLTGTNFIASSTVNFGANPPLVPTSQTPVQLQVTVPAGDIATGGNVNVTVTNPAPGGGTTAAQSFTVTNPAATITSFSPTSATAGGAAFTLTINGSNFVSGATGTFNGNARTVTFLSATQVTMAVTAPDIAAAGSFPVVVSNPAPGGGSTGAVLYTVNNVVPTLTSISPTSATAGGAAFTLTLNGTGFVSGSTVKFGVAAPTATFVSATQLTAAITAANIATAGAVNVSVTNPAPGGGTSGTQTFSINNPVPSITSFAPANVTAGGVAFTLTINGANFVSGATGTFNGVARTVTFLSAAQVTMAVTGADIATAGAFPVVISNPAPGGGASAPSNFTVNNPVPAITSLSPTGATAGGTAFTLTVNGTGFVASSSVSFNGTARTTTFVSATQVTAAILASDIAAVGTPPVTVTNPAPGGGISNAVNFNVSAANNPVPTLTSISPTSATAGGAAFTLTLTGTNFIASSTVSFGANPPLVPTSQTATQLQVTVPAADIATGSSLNVTVTNPGPGGGTTLAQVFTVNNPVPTTTSISPTSATAGGAGFTLTVNGTNFNASSVVNFNGAAKTTAFVSATQITATILASDIATAGSVNVTVTNAAPGGGTSGAQTFTINNPAPTITSLSPTGATAGGAAFTLTVNGTGFIATSVVNFNGSARTTTFVSATQITASITAADISTAGTFGVTVTNPAPGGGTSAAVNFAVNNPVPTITSLSPNTLAAGGPAFTLTVNGTNFIATSQVKFNGTSRTTTFVSATQITAAILASDIAASGNANVTVTNPTPGGGTTTNFIFVITTAPNPVPTLTSIAPLIGTLGQPVTLTLTGTNFITASVVNFGANADSGGVVSNGGNTLTITIPGAQLNATGPVNVTVTNPTPGGGTTTAQVFNVQNPVPTVTTVSPTSATVGGAQFTLTVNGTGFVNGATVNFNGGGRTTIFVSATQLTATVLASDIAATGTFPVSVTNPSPGGGSSNSVNFNVTNPPPVISTLSPANATAGGAGFTLTVNGSAFVNGAVVNFNGAAKTTAFVSATQVTATILAADIATAGTVNVTVTNPAPGGGTSAPAPFTINNPLPTITTLSPNNTLAGSAAFTLTVNGTNFVASSVVNFNGAAKTTTFVSVTQVTAAITAADIATAGSLNVTVTNPAPSGGTSAAAAFTVNNSVPAITSVSPTFATAGGPAFVLTVNGTNFVSTSVVQFGVLPVSMLTTFVSSTKLTANIPASAIASAGPSPVSVLTPAPGGGNSGPTAFSINNPVPTITSIAPTSTVAGGAAFNLTVNGTGFFSYTLVNWNGANRPTTFVNSTQLTAAIPATDIVAAGTATITAFNPPPVGGTSTGQAFTINNPAPVLTTLSPNSANAGGAAFTLTVNGSKFVTGAVVSFNGAAKTTTFVNAGQVTAAITAADIATGGTFNVIVTNPAPTVGPSAPLPFNVNNPVPTVTSAKVNGATHASGGAALTMTIVGTNFVTGSTVNFGTNPAITPTAVTATQITVTIPASDVATAGNVNVTVTNPAPAGGTTAPTVFTVDGFTVSGPANTPVKAGQPANIVITITGTNAAGFANPITFAVTGLPAHSTATFSPATIQSFTTSATTTTLTIMTTARGAAPPSAPVEPPVPPLMRLLPLLWLAAMLAGLAAMRMARRVPQRRRYASVIPLAMLLLTGAVLAGCAGGKAGTPAGPAQLTVTATSGTMAVPTPANSVTLTVQ